MDAARNPHPRLEHHHELATRLIDGLEQVIRGKRRVLEYLVAALLAEGHVLLEDVPGLGKTTLAKTAARLIARDRRGGPVSFRRIQFTPDLLPYDITGVDIFDPEGRRFVFQPGPVFAQVLLADEINRTTPKVQSALLEVMAEHQVTVGNRTHRMDPLFFVIATQNPVETDGTYPLPLAQLDRFLMRLKIGYPGEEEELGIVRDDPAARIMPTVRPVCRKEELLDTRRFVAELFCDPQLMKAAVAVSAATRRHRGIELGCSPRASLMLVKAMRAYALVQGRDYCIDQDLVELAPLVLAHRMRLKDPRLDLPALMREIALHELERLPY
ncbi:MAG: AAA family ATPase [Spirochaetales bacterium]|nr:AAA family ATPase [Spirochaetales bacterium]